MAVLTDRVLWACARQQIDRFGDDALLHAAMHSDVLHAEGDLPGHRAWLAILDRIRQLSGVRDGEMCH